MLKYTVALGSLLVLSSTVSAGTLDDNSILSIPSGKTLQHNAPLTKNVNHADLQYDSDSDDEKVVVQKKVVAKSAPKSRIMSFLESAWQKFVSLFSF